jgi:hypothetical protein
MPAPLEEMTLGFSTASDCMVSESTNTKQVHLPNLGSTGPDNSGPEAETAIFILLLLRDLEFFFCLCWLKPDAGLLAEKSFSY